MITKDTPLPEVIASHPGARRVFDAYGLHGCGGPQGPQETVEFFARVHGVPLERLLTELEAAKDEPPPAYTEELGDILYRRFFRGAIVVMLTAGSTLGAAMLFLYGLRRSFTSLDLFGFIQAHANAQVFGWVGLFVMGFACQGLPRFKYVKLWRPELAAASFVLMAGGLALRMAASLMPALGTAGGLLELSAVGLFVLVMARTLRGARVREPWDRYVAAALGAFLLAALAEPALYLWLSTADTADTLIRRVADVMGPYRDLQLLGFAGIMILGVSQRILPTAFGFREAGKRVSRLAFVLIVGGILADMSGWLAFRGTRESAWAVASWGGSTLYAAGAAWLAIEMRTLTRGDEGRSTKFIRAAFGWLLVACAMMALEPLYGRAAGVRFSHAFHGAIRHAFTVGFISLMIVGVSSKVVPILQGIDLRGLPALWPSFALINIGNGLRVASQVATDFVPGPAFPVMGLSGVFEVAGFAIWGAHLWRLMGRRTGALEPEAKPDRITADMKVAQIVEWYPETLDVFAAFGFAELRNPLLRNTVARRVTVAMACGLKHVDEARFLNALNERIGAGAARLVR
jgi:hypothetical protein